MEETKARTIRDILNNVSDQEICTVMKQMYGEKYILDEGWFKTTLRSLPKYTGERKATIIIREENEPNDNNIYYHQYIKFMNDELTYVTDFIKWNELLEATITNEYVKKYGEAMILSIFIDDITFYGWTQSDVEAKIANIEKEMLKSDENAEWMFEREYDVTI